jgi:putative membrane protein
VLATVIVPLALMTVYRAWKEQFAKHIRIASWTLPLWLYVSVTGIIIYCLLSLSGSYRSALPL